MNTPSDKPVVGLNDVSQATGESLDRIRSQMKRNPELKKLFTPVSGVFVAESANLPAITEQLKKGKRN